MSNFTRVGIGRIILFVTIFLTGSILESSGSIQNETKSILLEFQINDGAAIREIADKYLKEIYEGAGEFRRNRKYKQESDSDTENVFTGREARGKVHGHDEKVANEWFPFPPPSSLSDTKWSRSNINDYFGVGGGDGEKSDKYFQKRGKPGGRLEGGEQETPKSAEDEIQMISIPLHPLNRPFVNFTVNSNSTLYRLEVGRLIGRNYLISVVVEKMNCRVGRNNSAKLYIGGENGEYYLCKEIDDTINRFQSATQAYDGDTFVNVTGIGDWETSGVSANLVASIYYETPSCYYCELNEHFCCGRKDTSCRSSSTKKNEKVTEVPLTLPRIYDLRSSSSSKFIHQYQQQFRCIPKEDANGTSLLCNGHPNCGFHCNSDELIENCPKPDGDKEGNDDNYCTGYYCREYGQDRFLVTVLLLILFCVFVPVCIFLFLCGRRDMRRDFGTRGRCPLPLEIIFCPFSMSADTAPGGTPTGTNNGTRSSRENNQERRQQQRGNGRRPRRTEEVHPSSSTQSGMDNFSFFDDLPPSYTECCSNKEIYPNALRMPENVQTPPPPPTRCVTIPPPYATVNSASFERLPLEHIVIDQSAERNIPPRSPVPHYTPSLSSDRSQEASFAPVISTPPPQVMSEEEFRARHVCQCNRHRNPVIEEALNEIPRESVPTASGSS